MMVPIVFLVISIAAFFISGLPVEFLFNEITLRLSRNLLLVMSLIIPVITGMGLNFGIVLGAMAGQVGLIVIMNYGLGGVWGVLAAVLISTPVAILLGYLVGLVLNRAKGKEMITSMILGFFANGVYQLIFIVMAGKIIPFSNPKMLMSTGEGLRNTLDLKIIRRSLDDLFFSEFTNIPVFTFILIALFFLGVYFFLKTKLGQEMRAVGQDMHIASISGINVDRTRIISIIMSTVLAAWGQIVYLQNLGTLNTYVNHEQVGLFAVAALLIGGATVNKASWKEAILGTFLFHFLFVVSPTAGKNLMGNAQIGEYFRVFVAYGVIGLALLLHAWETQKSKTQLSDL
ncbi:MAG: ABC transporter permease [Tissierellia bacterium]|nr:ABC transporter permease [Tissierellia bacterium]